eukprot:gene41902-9627_t
MYTILRSLRMEMHVGTLNRAGIYTQDDLAELTSPADYPSELPPFVAMTLAALSQRLQITKPAPEPSTP